MKQLVFALLLALAALPVRAAEPSTLRAGFAVVDLTPTKSVPLGGYAARFGKKSVGVHDPVKARAMVLENDGTKIAIVSVDLVGVSGDVKAAVVDALRSRGFTSQTLMLAATHNHSGPGALTTMPLFRPMMGLYDEEFAKETTRRIADAVAKADDALAPAWVSVATGKAPGLQRNRASDGGPVDDSMTVLRVNALDGKLRGLLVHFAAHPTILGPGNLQISAEWPGATCDAIERAHPGATALVLQGVEGDVSPAGGEGQEFERVASYGALVAARALATATSLETTSFLEITSRPELQGRAVRASLPPIVGGGLLGRGTGNHLAPPETIRVEFQCIDVAGLRLCGVPGEPTTAVGQAFREMRPLSAHHRSVPVDGQPNPTPGSAGRVDVLVACANDHLGYLTSRAEFRGGGYESSLNLLGPGAGDWMLAGLRRANGGRGEVIVPDRGSEPVSSSSRGSDLVHEVFGGGRELGLSHGRQLADRIATLLASAEAELVTEAEKSGLLTKLIPLAIGTGLLPKDLVIPALVLAARGLQKNIPSHYLDEMEGIADGAGVPYDSILLENTFLTLAEQTDPAKLLQMPARCTNMAFFGDATTLGQPLLVSTLDWGMEKVLKDTTVVLIVRPDDGHAFVSVTWPGMVGVLRAMGSQGLAVSEESVAAPSDTTADGVPINFLLRDVIEHANGLDDAVLRVVKAKGTAGYHVTIVDGHRRDARVVEKTATRHQVRKPVDGALWGCDPTEGACFDGACDAQIPRADGSSVIRYQSSREVFGARRGHLDARSAKLLLPSPTKVWTEGTLLACVFEPQLGRFHVCLGDGLDLDPTSGVANWATGSLSDPFADRRASAVGEVAPVVADAGNVKEGERRVFGKIARIPVEFDSPRPSGIAKNDRIRATLYLPADGEPRGAIIQLPIWKERSLAGEAIVSTALAAKGYAVFLFPSPYQVDRAPDGVGPGDWTISSDLSRTREAWLQGMADVLRASRYLETKGFAPARQAVMGISLGGHMAANCFGAYPDRFTGGIFLLAGGNLDLLLASGTLPDAQFAPRVRAPGVTREDISELLRPLDPLTWNRNVTRAVGERCLLVGAKADELVPPAHVEALAKALPGSHLVWVEGGHYDAAKASGTILKAIFEHLERIFPPR